VDQTNAKLNKKTLVSIKLTLNYFNLKVNETLTLVKLMLFIVGLQKSTLISVNNFRVAYTYNTNSTLLIN